MKMLYAITFLLILLPQQTWAAVVQLDVPFSVQAPNGKWRTQPFQDACEETSIIMVEQYYAKNKLSAKQIEQRILHFAQIETNLFGFHKDTNAILTAYLINEHSKFWGYVMENSTIDEIKAQIDMERPVIYHAYSPALRNPHYLRSMNPYHVFVIVGYDEEKAEFITHDPGTRFGKNFRYPMKRLIEEANHDWTPRPNTGTGARHVIFTEP